MAYLIIADGNVLTVQEGNYPQLSTGPDAEKPDSPSIGNMHIATDTGKTYTCYITGIWTLTNSSCKESYHNHTGVDDDVANSYTSGLGASVAVAPHAHHCGAGDGVNNYGSWEFEVFADPTTQYFAFNAKLGPLVSGAGGIRRTDLGMLDEHVINAGDHNGCYFQWGEDDTWGVITCDNDVGIQGTPITAPVEGDNLTILGQIGRILFFVNGVLVGNHTNYIIKTNLRPVLVCQTPDATSSAQRTVRIDYMGIEVMK